MTGRTDDLGASFRTDNFGASFALDLQGMSACRESFAVRGLRIFSMCKDNHLKSSLGL